jgi:hypothetical protein
MRNAPTLPVLWENIYVLGELPEPSFLISKSNQFDHYSPFNTTTLPTTFPLMAATTAV